MESKKHGVAILKKPPRVEKNAFMSQKWDEITKNRTFEESDIPALSLLCQWYAVVEQCAEDMEQKDSDLPRVAYMNNLEDVKAMPQLSTMKQASAEIRALNKQLGINDEHEVEDVKPTQTVLHIVQGRRQNRLSKATG